MTDTCVDCGSDLAAYEPVYVSETTDGERDPVGGFCNYACLSAYIDEAELTDGAACTWSPD
ncbi:hypothetical protein GJ629_11930 [Halapricum sp. CBA1109]|uniref:hypothetical protein n=1 Tax=Halapricum sp. CBA1109 TaxID=2668068 RepID=UPI0012F8AF82|nr:hypothetical protein [Halapricum sp. CBA1109]MUV90521.1 hypothetical protein [Halapricum sp. CBA1109]